MSLHIAGFDIEKSWAEYNTKQLTITSFLNCVVKLWKSHRQSLYTEFDVSRLEHLCTTWALRKNINPLSIPLTSVTSDKISSTVLETGVNPVFVNQCKWINQYRQSVELIELDQYSPTLENMLTNIGQARPYTEYLEENAGVSLVVGFIAYSRYGCIQFTHHRLHEQPVCVISWLPGVHYPYKNVIGYLLYLSKFPKLPLSTKLQSLWYKFRWI